MTVPTDRLSNFIHFCNRLPLPVFLRAFLRKRSSMHINPPAMAEESCFSS